MPTNIKVFGNIKDVSRFAKRCTVTIKLLNGPIAEDPYLIVPTEFVKQTDATGYFEAQLGLGDYALFIGSDQILFAVNDVDSGDKNIVALITTDITYTKQNYVSNWNGIRQGNLQFLPTPNPSAGTVTKLGPDAAIVGLDEHVFEYYFVYETALGITAASAHFQVDFTDHSLGDKSYARVTFNPTDDLTNVIKKYIYRSLTEDFDTFDVIAIVDPDVAYFDDKRNYDEFVGTPEPEPKINTTAGHIYVGNQLVVGLSKEAGFDAPFRMLIPFGATIAFDREITSDVDVYTGAFGTFIYGTLRFRNNGDSPIDTTLGHIFEGGIGEYGAVPPPPTSGYTGNRVLKEDGTWGAGGSGPPGGSDSDIQYNSSDTFAGSGNFTAAFSSVASTVSLTSEESTSLKISQTSSEPGVYVGQVLFLSSHGEPFTGAFTLTGSQFNGGTGSALTGETADDGSGNITGIGTLFLTELKIGDWFRSSNTGVGGWVTAITDDTHCTLSNTVGATSVDSPEKLVGPYAPDALVFTSLGDYSSLKFVQRGNNGNISFSTGNYSSDSDIKLYIDGVTGNVFVHSVDDDTSGAALQITGSVNSTVGYMVAGVQVVGAQQDAISDTFANTADNTIAINAILAALRAHGLIAT